MILWCEKCIEKSNRQNCLIQKKYLGNSFLYDLHICLQKGEKLRKWKNAISPFGCGKFRNFVGGKTFSSSPLSCLLQPEEFSHPPTPAACAKNTSSVFPSSVAFHHAKFQNCIWGRCLHVLPNFFTFYATYGSPSLIPLMGGPQKNL